MLSDDGDRCVAADGEGSGDGDSAGDGDGDLAASPQDAGSQPDDAMDGGEIPALNPDAGAPADADAGDASLQDGGVGDAMAAGDAG